MQFQAGRFQSYRATNQIAIGRYGITIPMNGVFDYDGSTIRFSGAEYAGVTQLVGVFGAWFMPAADQTTKYRSAPANVQVRPATPEGESRGASFSMGSATEDESVVGTMDESTAFRKAAADNNQERLQALRAQRQQDAARRAGNYESNPAAPPPQNAADVDSYAESLLMEHTESTFIQAQPLAAAGAPAVASEAEMRQVEQANVLNQARIAQARAALEQVDPYKTRDQMGGQLQAAPDKGNRRVGNGKYGLIVDEQDDGVPINKYTFSTGASVGSEDVARNQAQAKPVNVAGVPQQPVQVGRPVAASVQANRHAGAAVIDDPMARYKPQAAHAPNTTQIRRGEGNVGIDQISANGTLGDVDQAYEGDELSELLPDAIVAGATRRAPLPPKMTEEAEIEEVVSNWSVKRNWQKRVEEAVEFYGDWPEALEALYAIESPAVVKQIKARLASR